MEFINPIFEFSRAMNELQLNDAEFALLIAISIFSAGVEEGQWETARDLHQGGLQAPQESGGGLGGWRHLLCYLGMRELGWSMSLYFGCNLGYGSGPWPDLLLNSLGDL